MRSTNSVFRMHGELVSQCHRTELHEMIGDNRVDNIADDLKREIGIEFNIFANKMIEQNVKNFMYSFTMPQYEPLQGTLEKLIKRFNIMGGQEQTDLFEKIHSVFKDIITDRYAGLDPEAANSTAMRYADQMIDFVKSNSIQANTELGPDKGAYY